VVFCGFSKFAIADTVVASCLYCYTALAITAFAAPFTPILPTPLQLPLAVIKAIIIIVCRQLIVASLSDLFLIHYHGWCTLPMLQPLLLLLVFAACCLLNHGPLPWQLPLDVFTAGWLLHLVFNLLLWSLWSWLCYCQCLLSPPFLLLHHGHANTNAVAAVIGHTACWLLFLFLNCHCIAAQCSCWWCCCCSCHRHLSQCLISLLLLLGIVLNAIADGWLLLLF